MKKNIFKTMLFLLTVPAMLLTTGCSSEDDLTNEKSVEKKVYTYPVTINVTNSGDQNTTRAHYDPESRKLSFTNEDCLGLYGYRDSEESEYYYAKLNWVSDNTFSGELNTNFELTSSVNDLLTAAYSKRVTLMPFNWGEVGFITYEYDDKGIQKVQPDWSKAFVVGDKAYGIEQLSYESASAYSSGFALSPETAILSCTISGLAPSTLYTMAVTDGTNTPTGKVTTDASGDATFCVAFHKDSFGENNYTIKIDGGAIFKDIDLGTKTLAAGKIYNVSKTAESGSVNLAALTSDYEAQDGDVLTGTQSNRVMLSIAAGATVTLKDVNINIEIDSENPVDYAGINCLGSATIILEGTNVISSPAEYNPAIKAGGEGTLLTIKGTGSLTATGGFRAAGIGTRQESTCGDITISGGTITANGDVGSPGIGASVGGTCGDITITNGVTKVTATMGGKSTHSIGAGGFASCGTVTIGGTVYWKDGAYVGTGETYLTQNPLVYQP